MQVALEFFVLILPTAAVGWWAATSLFVGAAQPGSRYFDVAARPEIIGHLGLYAFVTGWVTIVLISVVGCLLVRFTSAAPGLYPTRGLRAALLLYRVKKLNQIQRLWTWTIVGQYLRALAGLRFTRVGASECDVMINLVPELAGADSQVFWSHGSFTNMLDHRAALPEAPPARHAGELLRQQQLRRRVRTAPHQLPAGRLDARQRHPLPAPDAVAARRAHHGGGKSAGEVRECGLRSGEPRARASRASPSSWGASR